MVGPGDPDAPRDFAEANSEFEEAYEPDAAEKRAAAEKEAAQKALARKNFLTALMSRPEARAWLWEILDEFDTFRPRFGITPAGFPDPQGSWYRAGMRDAGWWLWTQLDDADPDLASMMRREHKG